MANRTFKKGQSIYTCRCCGRQTRDTNSEGGIELCAQCYELAGFENMLSDSPEEVETVKHDSTIFFNELLEKGITAEKLASAFGDLYALCFPAVAVAAAPARKDTTKYDYPTGLTNAQKKAFRAKARRAK